MPDDPGSRTKRLSPISVDGVHTGRAAGDHSEPLAVAEALPLKPQGERASYGLARGKAALGREIGGCPGCWLLTSPGSPSEASRLRSTAPRRRRTYPRSARRHLRTALAPNTIAS